MSIDPVSAVRAALARLSGWPRRAAALACLLIAATSFVHHRAPTAHTGQASLTRALVPGQVAVAVQVGAEVRAFVHPGDRVDLVAAADDPAGPGDPPATPVASAALARGVAVLALLPPPQQAVTDATAGLVVAADRATATALAAARGRQLTALLSG